MDGWIKCVENWEFDYTTVASPGNPQEDRPCIPRDFGKGSVVCVCNSTYCDSTRVTLLNLDKDISDSSDQADGQPLRGLVQVWTSTKSGSRLHKSVIYFNNNNTSDNDNNSQKNLKDQKEYVYYSRHFLSPQGDKNYFQEKKPQTSSSSRFPFLKKFSERRGDRFLPFFNGRKFLWCFIMTNLFI